MPHRHFVIIILDALLETGVFPGTGDYPLGNAPFFSYSLPSTVQFHHMAFISYAHAFFAARRHGSNVARRDGRDNRRAKDSDDTPAHFDGCASGWLEIIPNLSGGRYSANRTDVIKSRRQANALISPGKNCWLVHQLRVYLIRI